MLYFGLRCPSLGERRRGAPTATGTSPDTPANALTLNGQTLALNGQTLILGSA